MSYSHSTIKPTKAEAKADLLRQFDEITIPMFPIHSRDRAVVEANLDAALAQLDEQPDMHVAAYINGYMSYTAAGTATPEQVQGVGISASAGFTKPTTP